MADKRVKVVGEHVKGCFTMEGRKKGSWPSHWGPIAYSEHGPATVQTWRRYGATGRALKTWVRFVCNQRGCPAELHVEASAILESAKREMARRSAPTGRTK